MGGLHLMIGYEDGSQLTELPQVFRMPNAPRWMLGMANLHGTLIPVFDLAAYLGIEREATDRRFLLVLGHGADAAGVVIEQSVAPASTRGGSPVFRPDSIRPGLPGSALRTSHVALSVYIPSYCGPPPPSGGTQVITPYGSMMSHVLQ